ncbi:hypothetical protein [Burkholderia dolosa]|uniref:hypothetical protein n=1 Tax=Burkholderia dolosa TaxID=152500 RepID=UPI0015902C7E|nr:hypothetical protein [Burkholderia dolosa]MBY4755797.1 hypothetical protein [Burkholderia dolosa]
MEDEPNGFWPIAFISGTDESGKEIQLARLDYRLGQVSGQVSRASHQEALADAKRYHSPRMDENGNLFLTCEGVEYDVKTLA